MLGRGLIFIVLYCFIFVNTSVAQVVNVERFRLNEMNEGWQGEIDLNFSYIKNNNELLQFGNKINVSYKKERHLAFLVSDITFVKSGGADIQNKGTEHLRYNYALDTNERFYLEVFDQVQFNRIRNIQLRLLRGVGGRAELIKQDSLIVNLGALFMTEYEALTNNTENQHLRMSWYSSINYIINDIVSTNFVLYYQPDLKRFKDFRISSEWRVSIKVTKSLKFGFRYNLLYDEEPPEGIVKGEHNFYNSIQYVF